MSGRIGSACSAVSTSCASSRPLPSYTNRVIALNDVSTSCPENVNGEPYASWRHSRLLSSCVDARWYVAANVPVHDAASGRRYSTPATLRRAKTPFGPSSDARSAAPPAPSPSSSPSAGSRVRLRVQVRPPRRSVRVADPRIRVGHLQINLRATAAGDGRAHLEPRGQRLTPPEQVPAEEIRVRDERVQASLLQPLRGDPAAAAEPRALLLDDVDDGVHQVQLPVRLVASRRPRDGRRLQTRGRDEILEVLDHARVQHLPGLDALEVPGDHLRSRRAHDGLAGFAVEESNLHLADPRLRDGDLEQAVGVDDHGVPLRGYLARFVPVPDLRDFLLEDVRVHDFAKLRFKRLVQKPRRVLVAAFHDEPAHDRVRDELERQRDAVSGVHRHRRDRGELPGVEDPLQVRLDLAFGVRKVGLDEHHRSRELLELRGLAVEVDGRYQDRALVLLGVAPIRVVVAYGGRRRRRRRRLRGLLLLLLLLRLRVRDVREMMRRHRRAARRGAEQDAAAALAEAAARGLDADGRF
eukprot:31400-Pelagococcus_subviridis.AAC.5